MRERSIAPLLSQDFLDLDDTWERRFQRYVGLEDLSDDRTVAVFVRPL